MRLERDDGGGDDEAGDAHAAFLALCVIDVQDLVLAPEDHVAPNPGLGAGLDSSGAFDEASADHTARGLDADKLVELIQAEVSRGQGSIEYGSGRLVTRLSGVAFEGVRRCSPNSGGTAAASWTSRSRVYRMDAATFARPREQASALTNEAEAALAAGDGATLLASHHVLAHDGQRVHVWRWADPRAFRWR